MGILNDAYTCEVITKPQAIELLGTMVGGYNPQALFDLIETNNEHSHQAANQLKNLVLSVNIFDQMNELAVEEIKKQKTSSSLGPTQSGSQINRTLRNL